MWTAALRQLSRSLKALGWEGAIEGWPLLV